MTSTHSEQLFRLMLDNIVDYAMFVVDLDGTIASWNPGVGRLLGYRETEFVGQPASLIFVPEDVARNVPSLELQKAAAEGRCEDRRWHVRKDGSRFWANGMLLALPNDGSGPVAFAKVLRDETKHKLDQERVQESEKSLRQLNRTLDKRVEQRTAELRAAENALQQLAAQLMRAQYQERRRLARVLHDHLQQLLIGVQMHCRVVHDKLAGTPEGAALGRAVASLQESVEVTRTLAVELFPPVLQELGLPAGLKWLATQMREQHGLQVHVHAHDPLPNCCTEELRDFLFQSARELLLNVVKHAETSRASLDLTARGRHLTLAVRDEGAGFDLNHVRNRQSFGLFQIRQHLTVLGGTFQVDSAPGRGTRAVLKVPVSHG
jgi:PAS domain S-box-containing protein